MNFLFYIVVKTSLNERKILNTEKNKQDKAAPQSHDTTFNCYSVSAYGLSILYKCKDIFDEKSRE